MFLLGLSLGQGHGHFGCLAWKLWQRMWSRTSWAGMQTGLLGHSPPIWWGIPAFNSCDVSWVSSWQDEQAGCSSISSGTVVGMSVANGPGMTGLRCDTWNNGPSLLCHCKVSLYLTSLICFRILYGPIYLRFGFLHPWVILKSLVANQTQSQGWYCGVSPRWWFHH